MLTEPSALPEKALTSPKETKEKLLKVASSHCSNGCFEWKSNNSEAALQEFTKATRILESVLGTFHLLTAKCYFWIGLICKKSRLKVCLRAFCCCFRIRFQLLGSDHKATQESRQSLRWVLQKLRIDIESFLDCLQRSQKLEHKGDKKLKAKDVSSALELYQQAVDLCTKNVKPPPQLLGKYAFCHKFLQKSDDALLWYRKQLLALCHDTIHQKEHPEIKTTWNEIKKLLNSDCNLSLYEKMARESMEHQIQAELYPDRSLSSQSHYLKALHLELQFIGFSHPFTKDLVHRLDVSVVEKELRDQNQIADNFILAEALVFNRNNKYTSQCLIQLEKYRRRAKKCLEILLVTHDIPQGISSSASPNRSHSTVDWNISQSVWLDRQVQAVGALLDLLILSKKKGDGTIFTNQELLKDQSANAQQKTSASIDIKLIQATQALKAYTESRHSDLFRENMVLQIAQEESNHGEEEDDEKSSKDGRYVSCIRDVLKEAKNDLDVAKRKEMANDQDLKLRIGHTEKNQSTPRLVTPAEQSTDGEGLWNNAMKSVDSVIIDTALNPKDILKLQKNMEHASEKIKELITTKKEQTLEIESTESLYAEMDGKLRLTQAKLQDAIQMKKETTKMIEDLRSRLQRPCDEIAPNHHQTLEGRFSEKYKSIVFLYEEAQQRVKKALNHIDELQLERHSLSLELETVLSSKESCETMLRQYKITTGQLISQKKEQESQASTKLSLIENLLLASRQETDYFRKNNEILSCNASRIEKETNTLNKKLVEAEAIAHEAAFERDSLETNKFELENHLYEANVGCLQVRKDKKLKSEREATPFKDQVKLCEGGLEMANKVMKQLEVSLDETKAAHATLESKIVSLLEEYKQQSYHFQEEISMLEKKLVELTQETVSLGIEKQKNDVMAKEVKPDLTIQIGTMQRKLNMLKNYESDVLLTEVRSKNIQAGQEMHSLVSEVKRLKFEVQTIGDKLKKIDKKSIPRSKQILTFGKGSKDVTNLANKIEESNFLNCNELKRFIEKAQNIFISDSVEFIIRRPFFDGQGSVLDTFFGSDHDYLQSADARNPSSIQLLAKISHDGSYFALSDDSHVIYNNRSGLKDLGRVDNRGRPLGWVHYIESNGKKGHYSLGKTLLRLVMLMKRNFSQFTLPNFDKDEIFEQALVFRHRYCESIISKASPQEPKAIIEMIWNHFGIAPLILLLCSLSYQLHRGQMPFLGQ
jgi:hypothetical protein